MVYYNIKLSTILIINNTCFCYILLKGLEEVTAEILEILSNKNNDNLLMNMKIYSENKDYNFEYSVEVNMLSIKKRIYH